MSEPLIDVRLPDIKKKAWIGNGWYGRAMCAPSVYLLQTEPTFLADMDNVCRIDHTDDPFRGLGHIWSRHPHDVDFEHDSMVLAQLELSLMQCRPDIWGKGIEIIGRLDGVRGWAPGDDWYGDHGGDHSGGRYKYDEDDPESPYVGNFIAPKRPELQKLRGQICHIELTKDPYWRKQ